MHQHIITVPVRREKGQSRLVTTATVILTPTSSGFNHHTAKKRLEIHSMCCSFWNMCLMWSVYSVYYKLDITDANVKRTCINSALKGIFVTRGSMFQDDLCQHLPYMDSHTIKQRSSVWLPGPESYVWSNKVAKGYETSQGSPMSQNSTVISTSD